jgi:hypothetical protein
MRRYLPFSVLPVLFACLSGCGDAPSRPSVIADSTVNPPKTSARYIQTPWDISLPGALDAGAATAATGGESLTGTFVNSHGFAGTFTGTLDNGTFTGSLKTITASGCLAERQFTGPLNAQTLNWSPGSQINDCGGASPLTAPIQVAAAPSTAAPCTYASAVSATSVPAAGGSVTVTVTASAGCTWFATSSDSFVTLSAAQGTADGTVTFTVAANPSGTPRTAMLVVAAQSFEMTQAGALAPVCRYGLNDTARTFEAAGVLGGVDMRAPPGCAWQAQSDAPWLTITNGSAGSGDRAINFSVAANPGPSQRVGTITAAGAIFTVTQNGLSCAYTVTPPATTELPSAGGTGTAAVATQAGCAWAATSSGPWITVTPPAGATGPGSVAFTVAANNEETARTGAVTVAGRAIAIMQAAGGCVFALYPTWTTVPADGGEAKIWVAAGSSCAWTATRTSNPAWMTFVGGVSGQGNGGVTVRFPATSGQPQTGVVTIGNASGNATVTFARAGEAVGSVTGAITNKLNNQPAANVPVTLNFRWLGYTDSSGRYSISLPPGTYQLRTGGVNFVAESADGRQVTITAGQTITSDFALTPSAPSFTFWWNPRPVSVNPQDPGCGVPDRYCWSSTVTIGENGFGSEITTAYVNTWVVRFYNPDGTLDSAATQTRTGAEFAEAFGVTNPFPANGSVSRLRQVTLSHPRGGAIAYVLSGVDAFGRPFSFTSDRLVLNPFGSIATLTRVPSAPAAGRASDEGPATPASNTIRRR